MTDDTHHVSFPKGYFRLLGRQFEEAELILKSALDRLIHIWMFDSLERIRCPRELITVGRLHVLLCIYLSRERNTMQEPTLTKLESAEDESQANRLAAQSLSREEMELLNLINPQSTAVSTFRQELIGVRLIHMDNERAFIEASLEVEVYSEQ